MSTTNDSYDRLNMREHLLSEIRGDERDVERFESLARTLRASGNVSESDQWKWKRLITQIEEQMAKARLLLAKYREIRIAVQQKLAEARHNAQTIGLGTRRIVTDRLRADFSEAEVSLVNFIKLLEKQEKAVDAIISRIHLALKLAEGSQWQHSNVQSSPAPATHSDAYPDQKAEGAPEKTDFRTVLDGLRSIPTSDVRHNVPQNREM